MRKILLIAIFSIQLFSSTRGDVKLIEASENIQYLSQKIVVDYLMLSHRKDDIFLRKNIDKNIEKLKSFGEEISEMSKNNVNSSSESFLNYFNYTLNEIRRLSKEEKSLEKISLVLDFGEHFIEGANAIIDEHKYNYTKEEKMLMLSKKAQYLFEYVMGYYIALKMGLDGREKINIAIIKIDNILTKINEYNYSSYRLKSSIEEILSIWATNRAFFLNQREVYIPHILLHSIQYSQDILKEIEQYHKKNL